MWTARAKINNQLIEKDLSPEFRDPEKCIEYIHKNLQILEYLLREIQRFLDLKVDNKITFRFGSYIRAYNKEQKRFVDGFDL